jgi:hypothetical protein
MDGNINNNNRAARFPVSLPGRFFRKLTIALVLFPLGTTRLPAHYNSLHTFQFELGLP